jgi:ABC-type polar amino acid transport system ATPase subunit
MQNIVIKDFGPIRSLNFDLNNFSMFFGPQASGKSTLSKSIYFFKSIRDEIYEYIANHIQMDKDRILTFNNFTYKLNLKFRSLFGFSFLQNNFYMHYTYNEGYSLSLKRVNNREINFGFSGPILNEINRLINFVNSYNEQTSKEKSRKHENLRSIIGIEHRSFLIKIRDMLNEIFNDSREILYIPAGRSLISTLSNKLYLLFQISENDRNVDYLIREFSQKIMDTRDYFDRSLNELIYEKNEPNLEISFRKRYFMFVEILRNILGGDYRFVDGKDRFYISPKNYIPLNLASSGQQESVWILYLMIFYYLEERECFMVIEEPEAHLFPEAQRDILRAIALFANNGKNQCIVTTHSPYIVSSVNNLLYSKNIYNLYGKVNDVIEQEFWMDPQSVAALFLSKSSIENMLDEETNLLTSRFLDEVSDINSHEFETLYRIEMQAMNFDDGDLNIEEEHDYLFSRELGEKKNDDK